MAENSPLQIRHEVGDGCGRLEVQSGDLGGKTVILESIVSGGSKCNQAQVDYQEQLQQWTRERLSELTNKEMANSTMYDQSLLTLSSSFLGGSLALLDRIVPENAKSPFLEDAAYLLFLFCIVLVIVSFVVGQAAIKRQKKLYEEYRDGGFVDFNPVMKNRLAKINDWINRFSGGSFLLGLVALTTYVMRNLGK